MAQTKAQVKVIQTNLNRLGANLKIDGIAGKLTNAAIAKYGSGGGSGGETSSSGSKTTSTSTKTSTPKSTTQASGYKTSGSSSGSSRGSSMGKQSILANPFASGAGNFFKNVAGGAGMVLGGIKDAINTVGGKNQTGAVLNAVVNPTYTDNLGNVHSTQVNPTGTIDTPSTFLGKLSAMAGVNQFSPTETKPFNYTPPATTYTNKVSTPVVDSGATVLDAQGNYYTTAGGKAVDNSGNPITIYNTTPSNTIAPTETTPPPVTSPTPSSTTPSSTTPSSTTPSNITPEKPLSQIMSDYSGTTSDPNSINNANNVILGINSDATSLQGQGSAWSYDNGKTLINNRVGSWTDNIAKNFNSIQAFDSAYTTNPTFKANVDGLSKYGITPDSVKAKIQTTLTNVNGVVPAQTTSDYLANIAGVPKYNTGDKTQDGLLTEEALMTQGWTKQLITAYLGDSKTVGIPEQDKIDAQKTIDTLTEREIAQETSVREKAQNMIDKMTAEFNKADAVAEINRINGKNSMVGLLASLGALDTSSAAGGAIVDLDQKYQAQRQDLRANYNLGVREIQMNMNDAINTLDNNMNDNIIKINSDLSKSDREISMEIMKLTYQNNKDMLGIKEKAFTALQSRKDKADAKALSYSSQYNDSLWKLMSQGNIPLELAKTMINGKGDIMPTNTNLDITRTYATQKLPETTPDYKGETLKIDDSLVQKFADLGYDTNNLIEVQNLLNQGWGIDQIAKNYPMPTDVFNLIKSKITTPQ